MAFVVAGSFAMGSPDTTLTASVTGITGSNTYILACFFGLAASPPSTITCNGVSMTLLETGPTIGSRAQFTYGLASPGNGDLVMSGFGSQQAIVQWQVHDSIGGVRGEVSAAVDEIVTSISNDITTVSGDTVVDFFTNGEESSMGTVTVGANQTVRDTSSAAGNRALRTSDETASGTTTTMSWSVSGSIAGWWHTLVALQASGGGGGTGGPLVGGKLVGGLLTGRLLGR